MEKLKLDHEKAGNEDHYYTTDPEVIEDYFDDPDYYEGYNLSDAELIIEVNHVDKTATYQLRVKDHSEQYSDDNYEGVVEWIENKKIIEI